VCLLNNKTLKESVISGTLLSNLSLFSQILQRLGYWTEQVHICEACNSHYSEYVHDLLVQLAFPVGKRLGPAELMAGPFHSAPSLHPSAGLRMEGKMK